MMRGLLLSQSYFLEESPGHSLGKANWGGVQRDRGSRTVQGQALGERNSLAMEPRRLQRVPLKYSAEHSSGLTCDLLLGAGEVKPSEMLEGW